MQSTNPMHFPSTISINLSMIIKNNKENEEYICFSSLKSLKNSKENSLIKNNKKDMMINDPLSSSPSGDKSQH